MKTTKTSAFRALGAGAALLALTAGAMPARAQEAPASEPAVTEAPATSQPREVKLGTPKSYWGFGLGYVFTEIPISQSEFTVFMSELYYSYYLSDPNASMRTALTLGAYGFALILPVPQVSAEFFLGAPTQDIQGKLGVGGFYDISVGGHAGMSLELGARLKDKVDVSFFIVPTGVDSKRDYLDFLGLRDEDDKPTKPYVIMPYFGLFLTFKF